MWTPMPYNSEPAMSANPSDLPYQDRDDLPGTIMIVDDNCEAGTALAALLELSDHTVQLFTTGRTALRAVEAKDSYTEGHLQRLAFYSVVIGERLQLGGDAMTALRYGALLHDVGKLGVDELIIRKGGPLTPAEYRVMQQHTLIGERIVQPLRMGSSVGPIVRYHHERWDGRGYPDGLAQEGIPLGARIVAVADAFDAMTTTRPYNRVLSVDEAAERLGAGAGIYWDPQVVAVFLDWLRTRRV